MILSIAFSLFFNFACPFYIAWVIGSGWAGARVVGGTRLYLYFLSACLSNLTFACGYFFIGLYIIRQYTLPPYLPALLVNAAVSLGLGVVTAVVSIDISARFHARRILSGTGK